MIYYVVRCHDLFSIQLLYSPLEYILVTNLPPTDFVLLLLQEALEMHKKKSLAALLLAEFLR
uniref:Uncharacterized protein n=1 Tax=Arundo donax TaxID=35708 RepID=A0A0A8ZB28_ARUDO